MKTCIELSNEVTAIFDWRINHAQTFYLLPIAGENEPRSHTGKIYDLTREILKQFPKLSETVFIGEESYENVKEGAVPCYKKYTLESVSFLKKEYNASATTLSKWDLLDIHEESGKEYIHEFDLANEIYE